MGGSMLRTFKFRAECSVDILGFFQRINRSRFGIVDFYVHYGDGFSPVNAEITLLNAEVDDLRKIMVRVSDGHVMLSTVALKEEYTGERNWEIERQYYPPKNPEFEAHMRKIYEEMDDTKQEG